jgi:oligoendopeptidase F
LENPDRVLREDVYRKVQERRLQDKEPLNNLFTELVKRRDQLARNAGFANYRDYKFVEMGRFDYTKEECYRFHDSVKQHILPLVEIIHQYKQITWSRYPATLIWRQNRRSQQPCDPLTRGRTAGKTVTCFRALRPFCRLPPDHERYEPF